TKYGGLRFELLHWSWKAPGSRLATLRSSSPTPTSDEPGITSLALYHTALAPAAGAMGAENDE
ncbi:MAG: hypothetical protein ACP5HZ_12805, partial [Ferrimicrobium sp.]